MKHPYQNLPAEAFWKSAVVNPDGAVSSGLYQRKWAIAKSRRIATAGSCFAQHIGRRLRENGFDVLDAEPAPATLPPERHGMFGYGIYSARYGNIYTMRQMLQLAREAFGSRQPGEIVWEAPGGRFHDALRPGVEPEGLDSPEEVIAHRRQHLGRVRGMLENTELFIFTLGLTESWIHRESGTVFPTAPGTIAGEYDPHRYAFLNFGFQEIIEDFNEFRILMREVSNAGTGLRFLLTVSPVPLTATASGQHVLQATTHSKSVLRAVAGQLALAHDDIDYFPSYEIITNPWSGTCHYEANLRSVKSSGVNEVMQTFFKAHLEGFQTVETVAPREKPAESTSDPTEDLICEEALLEAFGRD